MRPIKFRAWDKPINRWYWPVYEAHAGGLEELNIGMNGRLSLRTMTGTYDESTFKDRFEINQYTGLKDKNGVEIYEGDIVRLSDDWGDSTVHEIKYFADDDYPAFDLEPNIDAESNGLSHYKATGDIEVIGNIYENPELLKDVV